MLGVENVQNPTEISPGMVTACQSRQNALEDLRDMNANTGLSYFRRQLMYLDWMRRQGLSSEGNYLVRPGWAISFLTWVDSNKKREAQQRREDQETEQPSSGEVERSLKKILTDLSHLSNGKRIARTDLKHEVEEITPEDVRVLDYLIDVEAFEFDAYEVVESLLREVEVSVEEPLHPPSGIEEHPAIDRHEIGKNDFKGYCAALNNLQRLQQMLLGATLEPPLSSDATFTSWRKRWCADVAHRLME
ncbi:hypothetical protein BSKO_00717 [Bryopsis sp. KO-2023]|nr:hypothetical protein BSKO_00717 [Bryopsis sp. KO-2023]